MDPVGLSLKEALPILKLPVGWLASNVSEKAKLKFQKWNNEGQIRQLARKIFEVTTVKTLWGGDTAVSLYKFYYPLKVSFDDGPPKAVASLNDLGRGHHYVVQGTAGQGKSIFLRFLTGQELRAKTTTGRIPLFVELRRIQSQTKLGDLLSEGFAKLGLEISDLLFDFYARSGRIVLLLDAFDEIESNQIPETIAYLELLASRYEEMQIVISARPESDIQRSATFRTIKLAPLTAADHPLFLRRLCEDTQQSKLLDNAIKHSSLEIRDLLTTPLLLTLLTVIYTAQQTIPETLPGFYEQLFDVLFFKHDRSKAGFRRRRHTKLDDSAIRKLFEAFCFQARIQGKSVLDAALFKACLQRASTTSGIAVDEQAFRNEIVKTVCLMQDEGFDLVFIHKSVAEFHAAAFIRHSTDEIAEKFYLTLSNEGRWRNWRQELKFLQDIDPVRYNKYFAIPSLEKLAKKIGVDVYAESKQLGNMSACSLADQGPTIPAAGEFKRLGWTRVVHPALTFYEERFGDRWLSAVSTSIFNAIKAKDDLVPELRALGVPREGPDGDMRLWLTFDKLLQHPLFGAMVDEAFRDHVITPLITTHTDALTLVHRETQKLDLINMLATQPISP